MWLSKSTGGVYNHNVLFNPLVQNPSKMSVKERLGFSAKLTAPVEKVRFYLLLTSSRFSFRISLLSYLTNDICYDFSFSLQVFSTSVGLTKTVYNPAALKAVQKSSEEALKKKQVRRTRANKERKEGGG